MKNKLWLYGVGFMLLTLGLACKKTPQTHSNLASKPKTKIPQEIVDGLYERYLQDKKSGLRITEPKSNTPRQIERTDYVDRLIAEGYLSPKFLTCLDRGIAWCNEKMRVDNVTPDRGLFTGCDPYPLNIDMFTLDHEKITGLELVRMNVQGTSMTITYRKRYPDNSAGGNLNISLEEEKHGWRIVSIGDWCSRLK